MSAQGEALKKEKKKKKRQKEALDESMNSETVSKKMKLDESINNEADVENQGKEKKKKKKKEKDAIVIKSEIEDVVCTSLNDTTVEKSEVNGSQVRQKREPPPYDLLVKNISVIASPLAPEKLTKRVLKCVKKGKEHKKLRRGVREVQKAVRKGEKGIAVFAGDVLPIDVYSHMPVLCEQKDVDYVYVPSKMGLGISTGSKRPTCLVMIKHHEDYDDLYKKIQKEIRKLPIITK